MPDQPPKESSLEQELLARNSKRKRNIAVVIVVAVVAVVVGVVALVVNQSSSGDDSTADGDELIPVRIADSQQGDFQDAIIGAGRDHGLDIEYTVFDDPYLPNGALVNDEVDVNNFQHMAWMTAYNTENDADLVPIFSTVVTQWGLFSEESDSLDDIPDSPRIAVPDDPANFARALFILEEAGLLALDDQAGIYADEDDIAENPQNIEFVRLAHEAVHVAYDDPDVDAVVAAIEDFDPELGLGPDDALQLEDTEGDAVAPYAIVAVTTAERAEDPEWERLHDTFHDERVLEALEEEKRGLVVPVDLPLDTLESALDEIEEEES